MRTYLRHYYPYVHVPSYGESLKLKFNSIFRRKLYHKQMVKIENLIRIEDSYRLYNVLNISEKDNFDWKETDIHLIFKYRFPLYDNYMKNAIQRKKDQRKIELMNNIRRVILKVILRDS